MLFVEQRSALWRLDLALLLPLLVLLLLLLLVRHSCLLFQAADVLLLRVGDLIVILT